MNNLLIKNETSLLSFSFLIIVMSILLIISIVQYSYGQPNCPPASASDQDNDSIPDELERTGIPGLDLPAKGADPKHKDIFVEIDYMPFHKPTPDDVALLTEAFKNAGDVCNPDKLPGINLHVEVDEEIGPHINEISINYVKQLRLDKLGSVEERNHPNSQNIIMNKKDFYKYGFMGHGYTNPTGKTAYSGFADGIPGKSFLVTLGIGSWTNDTNTNHRTGNIYQKTGTIMHELGHTLGLRHGGFEDLPNYKPNYVSVLNYAFQTPSLSSSWTLDYSKCKMNSLNENALNESEGIGPECFPNQKTVIFGKDLVDPASCPYIPRLVDANNSRINYDLDDDNNELVSIDLTCNSALDKYSTHSDWEALKKIPADLAFSTQDSLAGVPVNETSPDNNTESLIELTANDHQAHLLYQVQGVQQLAKNVTCPICGQGGIDLIEEVQNLAGEIIGNFDPTTLAQNITDAKPPTISPPPLPEVGGATITMPQRILNNDWEGAIQQLNIIENVAEAASLATPDGISGDDALLMTINNFQDVLEKQKWVDDSKY
jgi:hypothetical protein